MNVGLFRLGLLAWRGRRSLASVLAVSLTASVVVPVGLATLAIAAATGHRAPDALAALGPVRPMATWVVTQPYGCTGFPYEPPRGECPHFHFGVDLAAPAGSPVRAVLPGQAEVFLPAGPGGGYGLHVVVHHGDGLDTMYAHLQDVAISSGQQVVAGDAVGREGSSGLSTGPHLHFEVREAGIAVDPVSNLPALFGPGPQPA